MESRLATYAESVGGGTDIDYGPIASRPAVGSVADEALYVATDETPELSGVYEVINVKDYGAVGDGTTNDYAAIVDAYNATPTGGTLFFPPGNYKVNSTLTFAKQIRIQGSGIGSAITVNVGTSADGVVIGTTSILYGLIARDFAVLGGASSCRYALVVKNLAHSDIGPIWAKAGTVASTGYAVSVEGCLINRLFFICPGDNGTFPYAASSPVNGVRVVGSAAYPSNANWLKVIAEAGTGLGLLVDASVGTAGSFNNWISGTFEGWTSGYGVYLNNCTEFSLRDCHIEGTLTTNNRLTLAGCQRGEVGGAVFVAGLTEFTDCNDIKVDGLTTNDLTISSNCERLRLGRVHYGVLGGTFTDSDETTIYTQGIHDAAFVDMPEQASAPAAPAANKGRMYFEDNGSGKTRLVVKFPTGAAQVVATQP